LLPERLVGKALRSASVLSVAADNNLGGGWGKVAALTHGGVMHSSIHRAAANGVALRPCKLSWAGRCLGMAFSFSKRSTGAAREIQKNGGTGAFIPWSSEDRE
jgi:hypothetical protein